MVDSNRRTERRSGRPTLDDVAKLAGVSRMVASRAVNKAENVSPAASARVFEAIERLGYVQHQGARSLATNRVDSIAFLTRVSSERFFADPNFARGVRGAKEVLSAAGLQLITLIVEDDADARRAVEYVKKGSADGVLVFSPSGLDDVIRELCRVGVPVATNRVVPGAHGLDTVTIDVRTSARTVAQHLHDRGVRRLTVLGGIAEHEGMSRVQAGVADVFGVVPPERLASGDHSRRAGELGMIRLLEQTPDLDGVLVASDVMAAAAISVLQGRGLAVPGDVRVSGWDNSVPPDAVTPSLTTLDVPFVQIGRDLATRLVERLAGADGGRSSEIPTTLIVRDST